MTNSIVADPPSALSRFASGEFAGKANPELEAKAAANAETPVKNFRFFVPIRFT
jgi:hypothetical protein